VLLLSSKQNPYDAEKGAAAGADGNLDKPFDSQVLIDRARALVGARAEAAAAPAIAAPAAVASEPSLEAPSAPAPVALAPSTAVSAAVSGQLSGRLEGLGLTAAQVESVLALSREVVERVVWEVVPVLAETLIKEEIARLTR
jgi:hypothetical protein